MGADGTVADGATAVGADGDQTPPLEQPSSDLPAEVDAVSAAPDAPVSGLRREPQQLVGGGSTQADEEEGEIDRVLLAKEFSGLLQLDSDGDEDRS